MHILRRLVLRCPAHEYGTITERTGLKDILCDVIVSEGEKERGREGERERGREGSLKWLKTPVRTIIILKLVNKTTEASVTPCSAASKSTCLSPALVCIWCTFLRKCRDKSSTLFSTPTETETVVDKLVQLTKVWQNQLNYNMSIVRQTIMYSWQNQLVKLHYEYSPSDFHSR